MANEQTPQGTPSVFEFWDNMTAKAQQPAVKPAPEFKPKTSTPIKVTNTGAPTINDWNNKISEIASVKVDPLRFSQPSQFGAGSEGFNLKRYYAHPDVDVLGLNPGNFDTEQYYNEHGRVGGDFIRMAKYLPGTMWGFTKDYLKPYRHPSDLFDATPDIEGAKAYQDGMSIMMSSKPGFAGSSVNFFANLAPTLGIAAGVLIEESAIAGTKFLASRAGLTAATRPLDAAAAKNILRIPSLIERGKAIKTGLSAFSKADNLSKLRMIWEGQKGLGGIKGMGVGFAKEINPLKNTIRGLDEARELNGVAAIMRSVGGGYADLQRARFAIGESQTEGGGAILERIESGRQEYSAVQQKKIASINKEMQSLINQNNEITDKTRYEQLHNELIDAKQKLSTGPTGEDASQILTIAEQNGKAVTLINLPIIYMTNAFGFEKIIGHGAVKRSLADQFVKNYNKHLVKSTIAGAAGKASYELIENNIKRWGKKAYLKHAMMQTPGRLLDYLGKNTSEGIQELFQEGAIKGVDHYYTTKFQDPLKFHKGVLGESILVGANSQYSKEGLEVFMQGLLSGGAIYTGTSMVKSVANPMIELGKKTWMGKENYEKYAADLNDQANRVLTAAQKSADDPAEFYKLFDKAGGEQINYARVGHVAEALGDEKDQRDIRNDATISYVHTLAQAGRLDVLIDNLKDLRQLNAEELANALGEDYVEADQAKYFSRLEKAIRNVQDLGQRFESFREKMPNKYDPSKINKFTNPEAYAAEVNNYNAHEEATFFAVYSSKTFEETLDRIQGIQEKFAAIPSFSRMPGMRASKIFSVSQMQDDVKSLRAQAKINEENGETKIAKRLTREADNLENLANASSIYSTLLSLAGKSTLTAEEKRELEDARKAFIENLDKKNLEDETEFTLDDLTSQDALDEYKNVLKSAFDKYFNDMTTTSNVRPFLAEELNDMFTMYNDWHSLGTDNRNMAKWVNMLTDPVGFNEFKNNIGYSLKRVYEKRKDILREQKKKFMKGMIQNAFLKALFEQQGVFVSVEDIEAFEKNDRYPTLIDAKTLEPIKGNDLRIPAIEEMFDNYEKVYNKVVKERPIREAAAELGLLEEYFSFAHKKKNGQDTRNVQDYANELGIDMSKASQVSMDDLCNFIINSKFATSAEKKLAQKILSLNKGDMKVTIRPNHSVPISNDPKNGLIIDFRYASSNYKDNDYRAEYLVLKGMMMSLTTDFLQDEEFAAEVEEMMDAVKATVQTNPSLLDDFGGKIPMGMASPVSFINEVMTNPQFQALLIQVKSTRTPKESTFTQVINSIKKFIKNTFKIKSSDDNVLKQAVALVGLTIDQTDYLQKPGERRKSPATESVEEPKDEVLEEVAIEEEETTTAEETPVIEKSDKLTPEENDRRIKLLQAIIYATSRALKLGVQPLTVTVDGEVIGFEEANAEADALGAKAKGTKPATETPEDAIKNRKRKDLFPDETEFADVVGGSGKNSKISGYREVNGIGLAEYTNPDNGLVDVIMTGTSDNDYVGYIRIYERSIKDGKVVTTPTNRWTSKMENKSGNKDNFKTMLAEVQKSLPAEHEYTEKTNISLDGLRVYANNLKRGYELLRDASGNIITSNVSLNAATLDALRSAKTEDEISDLYEQKTGLTREEFNKIKEQVTKLLPEAELRFNAANGSVMISLPVLVKTASTKTSTATTEEVPEVTPLEGFSTTAEDVDNIDINTPVEKLPKDLSDLLYDAYKKVAAVAKIKESKIGFKNFIQTNPKAVTIIENWKKSKTEAPVEEKPEEPKPLDFQQIRDDLFARGWLPEDINGLTEDQVTALHSTGTTKEQALAQFQADAEFAEADKKVQALIKKLSDSFKASGVTKVEGGYEKDGNKVARVSDIVRDILAKKFTNTSAANRGNVLDPIFRDFFDGKLTTPEQVKQKLEELSGKVDSESGEKMMQYSATFPSALYNTMTEVKQYLNGKGLKIIGSIPTLFGDIAGPRAGEIDFLVYDKEGNLGIIDLKTSTRNLVDSYNDPADEYQYERGHTIQQLAYRELIRQATGEDITDIYILPIQLSTNAGGVVKGLTSLNTGTAENPSILLKLNTSRDIFEVTGYGRPAGSEVTRTQEEEDALAEAEKTKQQKRIDGLKTKLSKLRGEQIAAISSGNLVKINDLNEKIKKIVDELKLYGIAIEEIVKEPEVLETEETAKVKPEVGMIIKLEDGRVVKVKKVSKKQVTVVPLNDEDAIGEILDESVVEDIDKMVVSSTKKKKAPAPKPETDEVMNESKSNAETLANDKDAQAKLASDAEKMTKAQAQNNFLNIT